MQSSKLYVGNLNYAVTKEQLEELFSKFGEVKNLNLFEGKGFGFVEMATIQDAEKAMQALNNTSFEGRNLKVEEARPPRKDKRERKTRY